MAHDGEVELGDEQSYGGARPEASRRDQATTRVALEAWLAERLPVGAEPRIERFEVPESNGMSSETALLDASWTVEGVRQVHGLVARIAPDPDAMPVFPRYDMGSQFRVMQLVRELTAVPVPAVRWLEEGPAAIGAPFFVMEREHGEVPPDILPYDFGDNWLYDARPDQQEHLARSTIDVLAQLHAIDEPEQRFDFLSPVAPGDTPLRRHVAGQRAYYEWASADGRRSPLIEASFDWLDEHWPDDEGPAVLSWGDARIGNVMYRDFEPVAVLDWEMASLAPREVDLAWLIFLHRFFEDIAAQMDLPGMPHFLRRDDVAASYEAASGHTPRNLEFHTTYAALRHAIVMSRVQRRAIAFGEAEWPDDIDDMIMHRAALEAMLAGTYWDAVPTG